MKRNILVTSCALSLASGLGSTMAIAVDDVSITALQVEVSKAKSKAHKPRYDKINHTRGLPAEVVARKAADANLQSQINSIELSPGPPGPAGPKGP